MHKPVLIFRETACVTTTVACLCFRKSKKRLSTFQWNTVLVYQQDVHIYKLRKHSEGVKNDKKMQNLNLTKVNNKIINISKMSDCKFPCEVIETVIAFLNNDK